MDVSVQEQIVIGICTVIVAILGYLKVRSKPDETNSLDGPIIPSRRYFYPAEEKKIKADIDELFEVTGLDRLLLFTCSNGSNAPTRARSRWEHRVKGQESPGYHGIPVDKDGAIRLKDMITTGHHIIITSELEDGRTKDLCLTEGLEVSIMIPILTVRLANSGIVTYLYFSVGSKKKIVVDGKTIQLCKNIAYQIADVMTK